MIVVSAGGGRVGGPLARAAIEAQPIADLRMRVVAGPLMPEDEFRALPRRDGVEIVRSVPDLGAELQAAAGSLSQCAYNTALEILRADVPALVVPYAPPGEDEQTRRARALERRGALRVHDGGDLRAALRALRDFTPAATTLGLDGARRTAELLWDLRPVLAA